MVTVTRSNGTGEGRHWRRALWLLASLAIVVAMTVKFLGPSVLVAYDLRQTRSALAEVDLPGALNWLRAAELRAPDRADVQFLLGVVYRRSQVYLLARRHFERALALGYSRRQIERQEWMLLFQMGYTRDVEPLLKKLLERDPGDELAEDIYEAMVLGYLADHRVPDAGYCTDHWVEWRPESVRARLVRLYMYEVVSDSTKLQTELREILRIDPGRVAQRLRLAKMLLDLKRVDEALAECETCRKQAPNDPRVSVGLGACHFQLGRIDEAKREMESALANPLDPPSRLEALTVLGQVASAEHDFELARRCCTEALELRPHDATAAYGLGVALSRLGQNELAQEQLKQSQQLLDQDRRVSEINRALIKSPENVQLRLEMARIIAEQGPMANAAAWMQSVLRYDPNCREAHQLLATFFEEHGKPDLAQVQREALAETATQGDADVTEAAGAIDAAGAIEDRRSLPGPQSSP